MTNNIAAFLDLCIFICSDWYGSHQPEVVAKWLLDRNASTRLTQEQLCFLVYAEDPEYLSAEDLDEYEYLVQSLYTTPVVLDGDLYFVDTDRDGSVWLIPSGVEVPADF